jgi:regulator of RNase E activity RraA
MLPFRQFGGMASIDGVIATVRCSASDDDGIVVRDAS